MKKLLIATSAVVGLGLVSADFAAAQLETSFSGLVRVRYTDNSNDGQEGSLKTNKTRLTWGAKGTTDSGLTYGGQIRWEDAATVAKSNVYVGGGFGTVTVGNVDGAEGQLETGVSAAASGGLDGGLTVIPTGGPNVTGNGGGADRLLYVSPSFSGLTFAADVYTDDDNTENDGGKKGMSAAVKYSGEFADGSFNVAAGLHRGRTDDNAGVKQDNDKGYGIGADMTFGPISVGANYQKTEVANVDNKAILTSAKYNFGPGNVSLGLGRLKVGSAKALKTVVAGVDYTVAPGWSVYAEAARNSGNGSNTNWLLGTNLSF